MKWSAVLRLVAFLIVVVAGALYPSEVVRALSCEYSKANFSELFMQLYFCEQKSWGREPKKPKKGASLQINSAMMDPGYGTFWISGPYRSAMIDCLVSEHGWKQLKPPQWKPGTVQPPFQCSVFGINGFTVAVPTGTRKWKVALRDPNLLALNALVGDWHTAVLFAFGAEFPNFEFSDLSSLMELANKITKGEWGKPRYTKCKIRYEGTKFSGRDAAKVMGSCLDVFASKEFGSDIRVHFEDLHFTHPQSSKYVIKLTTSERLPTGGQRADLADDISFFLNNFRFVDLPPIFTRADDPPLCRDVGGYGAYLKRTGEVCRLD